MRPGADAKLLQGLERGSTRRPIEEVPKIIQNNLEFVRSAGAGAYPFLKLRKHVIDEAMKVIGVIAVAVYGGLDKFKEWRMPPRDPNGGIHSDRPGGVGDVENPREGITHRTD